MGKITETLKRFGCKLFRERNTRLLPAPEIIFRVIANGFDKANVLNLLHYGKPLLLLRFQD
jgi:hypothetical protein